MMRVLPIFALCLALCGAASAAGVVTTEHAESRLVPERDGFAPGETTWFAFSQKLQEGWHVYWKNPGDSGLALELQWRLPDGYEAGDIRYPTPERIPVGPLTNYGHHGEPVFLAPVTAPANAAPGDMAEIDVTARWLICDDICVPEEGAFSLSLPVAAAPPPNALGERLAAAARAAQPAPFEGEATFDAAKESLILAAAHPAAVREAYFFPATEGLIEPAAKQSVREKDGVLTISMTPGAVYDPDNLQSLEGVLVLTDKNGGARGLELAAARSASPIAAAAGNAPQGSAGLPTLLLMAFLGGIILNVMPCVFPILFIKAASLMKDAQARGAAARRHGLLYGAGVIATFAALGAILLVLRAGGEQLGWGFHLQSPAVVVLSAYVLLLIGLNLAGVFNVGASMQGVGGPLAERSGGAGAFFTGALAVFVAAPCIGPLLSAPMGAALLLPPAAGMAIFMAMAIGLAAPYVVLSFVPALGRRLPRPGPWMKVFKQALAFPVFAAAAYFLWVLAQQTGPAGLGKALAGALLLALAAWLFELSKGAGRRLVAVRIAAAAAAIGAIAPIGTLRLVDTAQASEGKYGALPSIPYAAAELSSLRAAGRPVFVDFTAAWCVTCQFNKLTVLSKPSLASAFAENGVAFMVADWTTRDPEVTAALAAFGASGVPFYVYYPAEGAPTVLPLPLSERSILKTVRE